MPEERIKGSKIDHDLSAGSTYTRVYTVTILICSIIHNIRIVYDVGRVNTHPSSTVGMDEAYIRISEDQHTKNNMGMLCTVI